MLIECIPNVSEGRRPEIVAGMADAIRAVPGVRLLDFSSDPSPADRSAAPSRVPDKKRRLIPLSGYRSNQARLREAGLDHRLLKLPTSPPVRPPFRRLRHG